MKNVDTEKLDGDSAARLSRARSTFVDRHALWLSFPAPSHEVRMKQLGITTRRGFLGSSIAAVAATGFASITPQARADAPAAPAKRTRRLLTIEQVKERIVGPIQSNPGPF